MPISVWVHKACGTEVDGELMYSDSDRDYYHVVCPKCQMPLELSDVTVQVIDEFETKEQHKYGNDET